MKIDPLIPDVYDFACDQSRTRSLDRIDIQFDRLDCLAGGMHEVRIDTHDRILLEFAKCPYSRAQHRWIDIHLDDEVDGVTMKMLGSSRHRDLIVRTSLSLCRPDPDLDSDDPSTRGIAIAAATHNAANVHIAHLQRAGLERAAVDDGVLPYADLYAAAAFLEDWWDLPPGTPIQAALACPLDQPPAFWSDALDETFDRIQNDATLPTIMMFHITAMEEMGWPADQLVMSAASISIEVPDAIGLMRQASSPAVEHLRAAHRSRP